MGGALVTLLGVGMIYAYMTRVAWVMDGLDSFAVMLVLVNTLIVMLARRGYL